MDDSATSTLLVIQGLIAPSVMLMSQALLLLGLSGRRGLLFNNISALEQKRLAVKATFEHSNGSAGNPTIALDNFAQLLLKRNRYVLLSIWSHIGSVTCFVLTSLAIGINLYTPGQLIQEIAWSLFVLGLIFVLLGMITLGMEEWLAYCIIAAEIESSQDIASRSCRKPVQHEMD